MPWTHALETYPYLLVPISVDKVIKGRARVAHQHAAPPAVMLPSSESEQLLTNLAALTLLVWDPLGVIKWHGELLSVVHHRDVVLSNFLMFGQQAVQFLLVHHAILENANLRVVFGFLSVAKQRWTLVFLHLTPLVWGVAILLYLRICALFLVATVAEGRQVLLVKSVTAWIITQLPFESKSVLGLEIYCLFLLRTLLLNFVWLRFFGQFWLILIRWRLRQSGN